MFGGVPGGGLGPRGCAASDLVGVCGLLMLFVGVCRTCRLVCASESRFLSREGCVVRVVVPG